MSDHVTMDFPFVYRTTEPVGRRRGEVVRIRSASVTVHVPRLSKADIAGSVRLAADRASPRGVVLNGRFHAAVTGQDGKPATVPSGGNGASFLMDPGRFPGADLSSTSANPFESPLMRLAPGKVPLRERAAFAEHDPIGPVSWSDEEEARRRAVRDAGHLAFLDDVLHTARLEPCLSRQERTWSSGWEDLFRHAKDGIAISSMDRSPRQVPGEIFRTDIHDLELACEIFEVPASERGAWREKLSFEGELPKPRYRSFDFNLVEGMRTILTMAFPREDVVRTIGTGRFEIPEGVSRGYDLLVLEGNRLQSALMSAMSADTDTSEIVPSILEWLPRMTASLEAEARYEIFGSVARLERTLALPRTMGRWWNDHERTRRLAASHAEVPEEDMAALSFG